ncbi:MAG: DUF481 domain-containing protein [Candidatus Omnitrophica bacterium]|nr:DUF481 domain-containing protein [Candidatus Omnitrophota bacterium]
MNRIGKTLLFVILFFCIAAEAMSEEVVWDRKVSLGYNRSSGNTDSSELNTSLFINRNRMHVDEMTLKGNVYYASSDKKMDAQKWDGSGRYAFSFGREKKWYNFYKMAVDHDRFANIDYRLLPSTGLGYWFHDTDSLKLMMEAAGGYEHTEYRDATDESKETVFISRGFLEKTIFENAKLTQDVFYYPVIDDFSDYRVHSETVLTNPVSDKLSLNVSFIDDYDSKPSGDTKKNDVRIITSLTYSF